MLKKTNREIVFVLLSFFVLTLIALVSVFYSLNIMETQNNLINKLYKHPLQVSNAALQLQLDIYEIHRDLDNILIFPDKEKAFLLQKIIRENEKKIYERFNIIKENILGEEGQSLANNAFNQYQNWKPIINEILIPTNKIKFQETIRKVTVHSHLLGKSVSLLYEYATHKANEFKNKSNQIFERQKIIYNYLIIIALFIFISITYFAILQIKKYVYRSDKLKEELKQKSDQFERIFDEAPNPIMLHAEDGRVLMINKAWKNTTGYSHREIDTIEKWIINAYGEEMHTIKEYIDNLYSINESVDDGEYSVMSKDKKILHWKFSSAPLGILNGKRVVISSAMDVTELKKKDEMMIAQSRSAAMGDMISMIAHQWRQPLSVISMIANNTLINIELDSVSKDELEKSSNHLLEITNHLSETINDFKNFFKPEKEKIEDSLLNVIHNSLKFIEKSFQEHSILYNINCKTDTKILMYERELIQVFINILNNAKEALTEALVDSRQINIHIEDIGEYIEIKISNNGPKIKEADLPKIFEPYFSTKYDKNGTGLGLYMCKLIIMKHMQGIIEVENTEIGVCFVIQLPKIKNI